MPDGERKGDHLCALVHGLWGNPNHMNSIHDSLRSRYGTSVLHILACKSNTGYFTYDGIETGGERVAREIEDVLEEYARNGIEIRKLSLVGYSLGGLVARYAVGILYSKGYFERIKPMNFTTFATPHLGVRSPLRGYHTNILNFIGARTLSASGRQLFLIDKFRDTNRPLLLVMAEKETNFYQGLSLFANKILYANVVNDRTTAFYTSGISHVDPFADLSVVKIKYLQSYSPVVIDTDDMVSPAAAQEANDGISTNSRMNKLHKVTNFPVIFSFILPVVVLIFLANGFIQNVFSSRRIRLHLSKEGYRSLPLWAEQLLQEAEGAALDNPHGLDEQQQPLLAGSPNEGSGEHIQDSLERHPVSTHQSREIEADDFPFLHLQPPEASSDTPVTPGELRTDSASPSITKKEEETCRDVIKNGFSCQMDFPPLALLPTQFQMARNLNKLGWRKFPVFIHDDWHSHAQIISRNPNITRSYEGKVVIAHWINEEFAVDGLDS